MYCTDDIYVYCVDMPSYKVAEVVTPCLDGGYTVYINAKLTFQAQQQAYLHALKHIETDDLFDDTMTADQKEMRAHGYR